MQLKTYIETQRGRATDLAKELGIPLSYLSQMASGERGITSARASAIEKHTDGLVTRKDTHPDTWRDIWPELTATQPSKRSVVDVNKSV